MDNPIEIFRQEVRERIDANGRDEEFQLLGRRWMEESLSRQYVYNFSWLGRPIIQTPQDIVALQEIIWAVKPDLIVETGIAHGGSLIFSASMLEICGIPEGRVVGIDIDIREHNRKEIEAHPMFRRITLIQGSSIDEDIAAQVREIARDHSRVMVILDSNHTHEHVARELELYSPLVSVGSYLVVFDTFVEDMPPGFFADRPWDVGNNPKTAVREFLERHRDFELDRSIEDKIVVTAAPNGFLRRVKPITE